MGYKPMVFDTPRSYPFDRGLADNWRYKPQGMYGRGINVPQAAHGARVSYPLGSVGAPLRTRICETVRGAVPVVCVVEATLIRWLTPSGGGVSTYVRGFIS